MVVLFRCPSLCVAFVLASASTAFATGIRIAGNPPSQSFNTMQAAIDAAAEGDLLLVQPGNYGTAVIDGKSLSIVAMNGTPHMLGLTVQNLASTQRLFVSGITMASTSAPGLTLLNDAGDVRFQSCVMLGGRIQTLGSQGPAWHGAAGIDAQSCAKIVLTNCQATGGDAEAEDGDPGQAGGIGLRASSSNVVLYEGTYHGGAGSEITNPGGDGGDGCNAQGMGLFASGSTFIGGHPGRSDYIGCNYGGAGGDGIDATNVQMQVLDVTLVPAAGGYSTCGTSWYGAAGAPIRSVGGVTHTIPGTHRTLRASALGSDAGHVTITVTGQPGDRFYLARSKGTGFFFQNAFHGVWLLTPAGVPMLRAKIPQSGVLTLNVNNKNLSSTMHQLQVMQGWCVDPSGRGFLTGPVHVELFDAAAGPDCNANGVNDYVDVITGTSNDINQNSIPDGCPGG